MYYCKYQVKPHLSPWFSAACAAAKVHRKHFCRLYQQNKSSKSKVRFRQTSNVAKGFLKLPNLCMLIKQKELINSQKLGSQNFWRIASSVLSKGKSAIPPLYNGLEALSFASDKRNLFAENFSENSDL